MLMWLDGALVLGTAFYGLVILWLGAGIVRSRRRRRVTDSTPSVSIIVAARNEAEQICCCLSALQKQDYCGSLQVIVVDDRSSDGTGKLAEGMVRTWAPARESSELSVVYAPTITRYTCPKKSALTVGIEASHGEVLLFTDADCAPPATWVSAMVKHFADGVGLVAGFACIEPLSQHRQRLLAVDNLGVSAMAQGSFGMGSALSCSGRNLAYRRSLWDGVGGFEEIGHLVSGDDVYFLRHVAANSECEIVFCSDREAVVTGSSRAAGFRDIVEQKMRHASKAGHYRGGARWLGVAVYGYHATLMAGLLQVLWGGPGSGIFLTAWISRWVMDAALIGYFAPRGRRDRVLLTFLPIVEALYLPYVLFFVPLGRSGRFRWKQTEPPPSTQNSKENG
jgi:hypothetical protein